MSLATPEASARYCVMFPSIAGPDPSFWNDMAIVLELLARYCNSGVGEGVTVWHRRTATSKWKLITPAQ